MKTQISTIPIRELASGDRLFIQVYKFIGSQPGKKAYLQSNLHGAEISGNAVISQLIEFLMSLDETQLRGEIWLVPVCNPEGTNARSHHFSSGRYHTYDGKDWNRIFWDYEKEEEDIEAFAKSQIDLEPDEIKTNYRNKILQSFQKLEAKINSPIGVPFGERYRYQMQSLCLDADYVIDLHSSTNKALDYLYCFRSREESARAFLLDYGILMNRYDGDAFDEAFLKPWLALEKSLAELGKAIIFDIESWTLELGSGMEMNPESVAKGVRGVKNYLASKGLLKIDGWPVAETEKHQILVMPKEKMKRYYAPAGGMVKSRVELGSFAKKEQIIYQLLCFNKKGELPQVVDVCAETDGLVLDVSTNYGVSQGDYVLEIIEEG